MAETAEREKGQRKHHVKAVEAPKWETGIGWKALYVDESEGGMIRLETLIELKFLNSSFSRLSSS